ncbi:LysR family transcriptional regulator [Pseudomonas guariconensis]|nr:LysR family transcriptional regulator [Pseudomonas guariconensis]MBF8749795.1 LysR family transcriptional regulator [Pseudomonas guariconensis]
MDVSMEQLQAFVAAVDQGNFTKAAHSLGRAQSAISAQITSLEEDLGVELFHRTGRSPTLTPLGARMLREARVVLERRQHLIGMAKSYGQAVEQKLTLAFDQLYPEEALGPICAAFAEAFPHVELKLLFPLMGDVAELVANGEADLGVLWRQEAPLVNTLDYVRIAWASVVLVCGKEHPFAQAPVSYEELKRHRQILVSSRQSSDDGHWRIAADIWSVESHWVSLQLVKENIGWALISRDVINASALAQELVLPDLTFDGFGVPAPLDMVWRKDKPRGPAMRWMQKRLYETKVGYGGERHFSSKPDF